MIEPTRGNILTDDAEALVNTVNCVGVMGKGIALQFKKAFPENFKAYEAACRRKEVKPGRMFVFETGQMFNPRYIINFPTKRHWRDKSRYEDIESGLKALVREVQQRKIRSIAIPPLGSGLGGLQWPRVKAMIEAAFEEMPDVRVKLYEPKGSPEAKDMPVGTAKPKMTVARALLIKLMKQYARFAYRLTLLEIQKLAYFLQESGMDLNLRYVKQNAPEQHAVRGAEVAPPGGALRPRPARQQELVERLARRRVQAEAPVRARHVDRVRQGDALAAEDARARVETKPLVRRPEAGQRLVPEHPAGVHVHGGQ